MAKKLILNTTLFNRLQEIVDADGTFIDGDKPTSMDNVYTSIHSGGDTGPQTDDRFAKAAAGAYKYPFGYQTTHPLIREEDEAITSTIDRTTWGTTLESAFRTLQQALSFEGNADTDVSTSDLYIDSVIQELTKLKNG